MPDSSLFSKRFNELYTQLEAVEATKRYEHSQYFPGDRIDTDLLLNWKVKARHLISISCGPESEHYKRFAETEEPTAYRSSYEELQQLKAVFLAAKEDFEGGYLNSVRSLIQAEVFGTELDQARELLAAGYYPAAAVISGTVLETALREMCSARGIAHGKLDRMNAELAKAGVYNLLVQKRITALADIRNNAAHGHSDQFDASDVTDLIAYTDKFLLDNL